jgi:hypothetical protein
MAKTCHASPRTLSIATSSFTPTARASDDGYRWIARLQNGLK